VTEPSRPSSARPTGEKRATLSRDLADFLIEFSIALHKHAMYPGGHPTLAPAAENVAVRLSQLLADRTTLSLGVARDQLVIDGVATDPRNALLHDLAERLHRHHLGAVSILRGVTMPELEQALKVLAEEAERTGEPLGLRPAAEIPTWPHVQLFPLTFDRLELVGGPEGEGAGSGEVTGGRGAQLWVGLARAALAVDEMKRLAGRKPDAPAPPQANAFYGNIQPAPAAPLSDDEIDAALGDIHVGDLEHAAVEPAAVAKAIESHERGTAYDQVIVGYLLQIAEELKTAGGAGAAALKKKMSRLVTSLDSGTLERLLEMGGSVDQRRKFVLDASQGMAVDAVVDIVKAATGTGAPVSQAMLRMLTKLGRHAERGPAPRRTIAESALREQVTELISGWGLADPNPDGYAAALQRMVAAAPTLVAADEAAYAPEPERLVQMAFESGAVGEPLERAVQSFVERGRIPELIDLLDRAPGENPAVDAVRGRIVDPAMLRAALQAVPPDLAVVDRLALALGPRAAEPLLDTLAETESRQLRRSLLDRLLKLPEAVKPLLAPRLADERWYVVRNALHLAAELPGGYAAVDATPLRQHADPRVRREALRVLFHHPTERTRAVVTAIGDDDPRVQRLAIAAAAEGGVPEPAVPLLASIASDSEVEDELRVAAVRALGASRSRLALEALLKLTEHRRRTLRDVFGAPGSTAPVVLAALGALGAFRTEPRARERLESLLDAKDPAAQKAAADALKGAR
jgi:hypothetical protein